MPSRAGPTRAACAILPRSRRRTARGRHVGLLGRLRVGTREKCPVRGRIAQVGAHHVEQEVAVEVFDAAQLGNMTLRAADGLEQGFARFDCPLIFRIRASERLGRSQRSDIGDQGVALGGVHVQTGGFQWRNPGVGSLRMAGHLQSHLDGSGGMDELAQARRLGFPAESADASVRPPRWPSLDLRPARVAPPRRRLDHGLRDPIDQAGAEERRWIALGRAKNDRAMPAQYPFAPDAIVGIVAKAMQDNAGRIAKARMNLHQVGQVRARRPRRSTSRRRRGSQAIFKAVIAEIEGECIEEARSLRAEAPSRTGVISSMFLSTEPPPPGPP